MKKLKTFEAVLTEHNAVMAQLTSCLDDINAAVQLLISTLNQGGKILLCGNGGSAADCQHIAAEFVVRYEKKRRALAAIALTTDSSILTAHANDYDFDTVFARQIEALGNEKDCLIAISTSGNSKNIVKAVQTARLQGLSVIALTGCEGGELKKQATVSIVVPSAVTARIQEAHIVIAHWWCGAVEEVFNVSNHA
ncbi:D-sedoheptulose-7-phosphate isomerase [Crenothrix polyspora]|uniref:Phosphoheptose isomerase n=1 Tax=Crenothrix polyspora TaxID=360316 RepID=A0A1R4HCS6_9GAMM|nr:SIS domain-containing protein [Crenothrix polyspora]SJM93690.1 Phosphoheptose isomerase [Crenothrix polyspora]